MTCPDMMRRLVENRVPERRPMDNIRLGADEPFEDEFALMKMTLMSPYLNVVFPRSRRNHERYCDVSALPPAEVGAWSGALRTFVRKLNLMTGKRIVLKSPTHSYRLRLVLRLFPQAKFIFMVRDPYTVFASTVKLWRKLCEQNDLQDGHIPELEELVYSRYMRMFRALERDLPLVPRDNLTHVRYEDLDARPVETVRKVYEDLQLADFDEFAPVFSAYLERNRGYKKNRYSFTEEQKAEILGRWRPAFEAYGYRTH
jgi:hypothetical protein